MTHLLEKMMSTEDFRQPKVKEVKVGGHWLEQMEVQAHRLRHCFERFSLHCGKGPLRRMPQTKLWSNDAKEMYASFSDTRLFRGI